MPDLPICEKITYRDRGKERRDGDYAFAKLRVGTKHSRRPERGYDIARHFAAAIALRKSQGQVAGADSEFLFHVNTWREETGHLSSISKAITHPSYLRIVGMGRPVIPLLLRELRYNPEHWFVALKAITGEDPVPDNAGFDEAVQAWLRWGEERNYC